MIESLFYYDGNLEDLVKEKAEYQVIDAKDGYKNNIERIKKLKRSSVSHLILTNQVALLNNEYVWSTEKHEPVVYLKDPSDGKWKHIRRFTRMDIKHTHNLERLYRSGEFDVDKAYREKAKKKTRELFRFRTTT